MYEKRSYVMYVCESDQDIFLQDKYHQIAACKKYSCIEARYVEKSDAPLMERPEFNKALKYAIKGKHSLLVYDITVLGKNAVEIDYLFEKIHVTTAVNDHHSEDEISRHGMAIISQYNMYAAKAICAIFLVSTGKCYNGLKDVKGSIGNPAAVRLFLNDDLFIEILSLKTLQVVYKFQCHDSLRENHEKILSDVEKLFR